MQTIFFGNFLMQLSVAPLDRRAEKKNEIKSKKQSVCIFYCWLLLA